MNILNKEFFIYDMDEFTKQFYRYIHIMSRKLNCVGLEAL